MEPFTPEFETRSLPVKLDGHEQIEFGRRLAATMAEKYELEGQAKRLAAEFKAKISEKDARIGHLRRCVEAGEEYREVRCEIIVDPSRAKVRIVRCDTSELVLERDAKLEELQPYLPLAAEREVTN